MATPRRRKGAALAAVDVAGIRRALLDFYDAQARRLPWRESEDPYRVWISEIMLQQTRVETVIPYYERWLARFPDIRALAEAPADEVLHAWQGLGYYTRARNLHRAAAVVRERHGGMLPDDSAALRTLPGIGDYTAGAIASIAYGRAEPAVDGNVRRVLSRLLDDPAPTAAGLRDIAAKLVPAARPGDFNQALMELGATLCVPRSPRCGHCPVARWCAARAAGTQNDRPARKPRPVLPVFRLGVAALLDGAGRLFLEQRPEGGLLGGMWGLPGDERAADEPAEDAARRAALRSLGGAAHLTVTGEIGSFSHLFSHRREEYVIVAFRTAATSAGDGRFFDALEARRVALSAAAKKMVARAFESDFQRRT
jgi:A/G-specific adenine glycosylase